LAGRLPSRSESLLKQRSSHVVVHPLVNVKSWAERTPDVEACRPVRCPACGAAGCPVGGRVGLVGHGLRSRQLRGPPAPDASPSVQTIAVRRYRCRGCGAIATVLPRGAVRARYFAATAIALACVMYGLSGASLRNTRAQVSPWRSAEPGWPALRRWLDAIAGGRIFASVRPWPEQWSRRRQAERVAQAVLATAPAEGALAVRSFAGAELLACA
jgi:hypothetical protein